MAILLKIIFHRRRPRFGDSMSIFHGYSFPSGHTMGATLLYGMLAVITVMALKSWRWRVLAVISAIRHDTAGRLQSHVLGRSLSE